MSTKTRRTPHCQSVISQVSSSLREYPLTLDRLPGVVPHSDGILSRAFLARAICSRMSSAFFGHTKDVEFALWWST